jgi:hypothetical protein
MIKTLGLVLFFIFAVNCFIAEDFFDPSTNLDAALRGIVQTRHLMGLQL